MIQAFHVVHSDEEIPEVFEEPDENSTFVGELTRDDFFYIDPESEKNQDPPDEWVHGEIRLVPTAEGDSGWLKSKYVGDPVEMPVQPIAEEEFVQRCARAEIATREAADIDGSTIRVGVSDDLDTPDDGEEAAAPPPVILADYLIALAWIETELTKFENRLPGTSAIGPFQITREEWADFLSDSSSEGYSQFQRFEALAQAAGAVYLTQCDWLKMAALADAAQTAAGAAPEEPYVPSFLNLFHARLVGAEAAFGLDQAHQNPATKNENLQDVLKNFYPDDEERAALTKRRSRFLKPSATGDDTSVNAFFEKSADILRGALGTGFSKLHEHFEEFVTPPASGERNWVDTAKKQQVFWEKPENTETSTSGSKRILEYFQATNSHPNEVKPWCGAFAAWCLANSGDDAAAASVFPGAAKASNWKSWGDSEIRIGSLKKIGKDALRGAIVVLHPGQGTGSRGHVAIALNRMENSDKIECISGNFSDTVQVSSYPVTRIAAIRVLDSPTSSGAASGEINSATLDLVKKWEGLRTTAYQDSVGVWTIGYGTTSMAGIGVTVQPGMTITKAQAEEFLLKGLEKFANKIKPLFKRQPTPNQFGAMLSLSYNIGPGAFKSSTCLRRFNSGDIPGAAEALTWFKKAGGKTLKGLVNRRNDEKNLFLTA